MKGSAPKSPETGSHAWRVKNFQPNWTKLRWEWMMRMPRIKRTIAKMLQAQRSMTAAKLLSARLPLPRLLRYSRMGDGVVLPVMGTGSSANFAGGAGSVFGTGNTDPGSFSVVMLVEDTILILWI